MRVLVIPDLHVPYHHPGAIAFLSRLKQEVKPTLVICIGDLVDNHYLNPHGMSELALSPTQELAARRETLHELALLFPNALACIGNHDKRSVLPMPCWRWKKRHRAYSCIYAHGDSGNFLLPHSPFSYVIGHRHNRGGVTYHKHSWLLNSGCLINPASPVFPSSKSLILGTGVVIDSHPEFIPYA